MSAAYNFLPWVRQGAASAIEVQETLAADMADRGSLPVTLRINDRKDAQVRVDVRIYGPGDITGIDLRQVVRTEPRHLTSGFESNYFPAIEFDRPDFPWVFTPAGAERQGRLRPWICLMVVRKQDGVTLTADPTRPLPVLAIKPPANPANELPDLSESWAWAHTQVVHRETGLSLDELLEKNSEQTVSRLICPRKLEANTGYYACVVPAFEAGCQAGLGQAGSSTEDQKLRPAWLSGAGAPPEIKLPVYYHWEFSTGAGGDFESLVRLLQGRPIPPGVGARDMAVSKPEADWPDPGVLGLEGALRPPRPSATEEPTEDFTSYQEKLRETLNLKDALPSDRDPDPVVGPPIYGSRQASRSTIPAADDPPRWLRAVNLDPRFRAIAGFGTLIVQDQQEQLMASAWDQLGDAEDRNQSIRQAELAREVRRAIVEKHLQKMSAEELMQFTAPVHARVRMSPHTFRQEVWQSSFPQAACSTTFRRIVRSRGPVARRMAPKSVRLKQPPVQQRLVKRLAAAPARFMFKSIVPSGLVSSGFLESQIKRMPGKVPDSVRIAAEAFVDYLKSTEKLVETPTRPALNMSDFREKMIHGLKPPETVPADVITRSRDQEEGVALDEPSDLSMDTRAFPHPMFPQPMYEALRDLSQDLLLPGVAHIPANTVTLLETNPRFVEAYMLGLNHEMGRELLWREYPADQRGTYFRRFWDLRGRIDGEKIKPIQEEMAEQRNQLAGVQQAIARNEEALQTATQRAEELREKLKTHAGDPVKIQRELETAEEKVTLALQKVATEKKAFAILRKNLQDLQLQATRRQGLMDPIHMWDGEKDLGENILEDGSEGHLVILIRGELLCRYPFSIIYAVKAVSRQKLGTEEKHPIFRGTLDPDITFLGFDLTEAEARGQNGEPGWFFVIQQPPTEPRFGLDVATRFGGDLPELRSWNNLSWGHLVDRPEAFQELTHVNLDGRLAGKSMEEVAWAFNSAHMARITLQRPFRIAIHADSILPPTPEKAPEEES